MSLTRNQLEELTGDIFQRTIDTVNLASQMIPKIINLLERLFGEEILETDLNPDEAVALGACIQAAMLKREFANAEKFKITKVTPLSLGLKLYGNWMNTVIKRNTSLPTECSVSYETALNDMDLVTLEIYEGERKNFLTIISSEHSY
ncbi:hypothetical protein JTB14_020129 [Gonioctena quinquepunctata]|nr:hypothetical protein JTB14_020129 [Gonioctena quinquepunctata]